MMLAKRLKNKYVQLFCVSCFKRINIRLFNNIKVISCPKCCDIMTIDNYIKKGIKTIHLKLYEKCA